MNATARQFRLIYSNFCQYKNVNSFNKSILLRSRCGFSSVAVNKIINFAENQCNALKLNGGNTTVYMPVRFKSKRMQSNKKQSSDGYSSDEDNTSALDEFKEGNKSDKNLAQIKVNSMRIDGVIKTGLSISRKYVRRNSPFLCAFQQKLKHLFSFRIFLLQQSRETFL